MIPNNSIDTPPKTDVGIVAIIAIVLPENDKSIAIMAAPSITNTLYTRVIANTPMFSPYVVFGGPPISALINVPIPSPSNERCNPGLSR